MFVMKIKKKFRALETRIMIRGGCRNLYLTDLILEVPY
jgi:hypothetical protein